jgi:hypothetical protein
MNHAEPSKLYFDSKQSHQKQQPLGTGRKQLPLFRPIVAKQKFGRYLAGLGASPGYLSLANRGLAPGG